MYAVVERRRVPERSAVLRDEVIALTGGAAAAHCPHGLRRVEVDDPEKGGTLVFLTNHLALGATTIAPILRCCFSALKNRSICHRSLYSNMAICAVPDLALQRCSSALALVPRTALTASQGVLDLG